MAIAGDALLLSTADVAAEFDGVIALDLGPVIYPLKLVFGFFQRAVTLINAERIPEIEAAVPVDVKGGQTGR